MSPHRLLSVMIWAGFPAWVATACKVERSDYDFGDGKGGASSAGEFGDSGAPAGGSFAFGGTSAAGTSAAGTSAAGTSAAGTSAAGTSAGSGGSGGGEDPCEGDPCNGGECQATAAAFECFCGLDFGGERCQDPVVACSTESCVHGTCKQGEGASACDCEEGWSGTNCDVDDEDACSPNPCSNAGTCKDAVGGFSCACADGFAGITCDAQATSCADSPCQHAGSCKDTDAGYECTCPKGYQGRDCETNIDDCAAKPCKNAGACLDGVASYSCGCATGFFGKTCSTGFRGVPLPKATDTYAVATAVSANGAVVVGWSQGTNTFPLAFRWTSAGSKSLGLLTDGVESKAFGVSGDGSIVVGDADAPIGEGQTTMVAFRWEANQMASLGLLNYGTESHASAISADGHVVVGYGDDDTEPAGLRWVDGAIQKLGGVDAFEAYGVSANGAVIGGRSSGSGARYDGNSLTLLSAPIGFTSGAVSAVSGNGLVFVGWGQRGAQRNSLRWSGMTPEAIGVSGIASEATAVSNNGALVVGVSNGAAMIWDPTNGIRLLSDVLTGLGVNLTGWTLQSAGGISADGKVIVGHGLHGARIEPWVARLP